MKLKLHLQFHNCFTTIINMFHRQSALKFRDRISKLHTADVCLIRLIKIALEIFYF